MPSSQEIPRVLEAQCQKTKQVEDQIYISYYTSQYPTLLSKKSHSDLSPGGLICWWWRNGQKIHPRKEKAAQSSEWLLKPSPPYLLLCACTLLLLCFSRVGGGGSHKGRMRKNIRIKARQGPAERHWLQLGAMNHPLVISLRVPLCNQAPHLCP